MNKFIIIVVLPFWILHLSLNAQQNPIALTTEAFLDFESCEGGTIEFVDENLTPKGGLKIANWEESFIITGQEWLAIDFVELDNDRFYIKVKLVDSSLPQIVVNLRSYVTEIDPTTEAGYANFTDQIEALPLMLMQDNNGEFIYRSRALILVTDKDRSDDNLRNEPYSTEGHDESEYDGVDDQSTDKTIYSPLDGKLFIKYITSDNEEISKLSYVCNEEVLKVKLNIVSLINPETGYTYLDRQSIIDLIGKNAQHVYNQACILLVDKDGNSLDVSDVNEREAPEGVDLSDGLQIGMEMTDGNGIEGPEISAEQELILNALKDDDPLSIDLFFLNRFSNDGAFINQIDGISFNDENVTPEFNDNSHGRSVFYAVYSIFGYRTFFVFPHEIGHVLTNEGHFGTSYSLSATEATRRRNLMKDDGTTPHGDDRLYSSKRLTDGQILLMRTATNIPSN